MKIPTFLLTLCAAALAQAAVVDFDSLPAGTILTNQFVLQNVLFTPSGSSLSSRITDVAANEFTTSNFGNTNPMALFVANPGDRVTIDFVEPDGITPLTFTGVSLRAGDGDSATDTFRVTFFDSTLNILSLQNFVTGAGPVLGGVTVTCPGCEVRRITVEAFASPTAPNSGMLIDDLTYTAAPEPSTWGLCALALAAFTLRRRK